MDENTLKALENHPAVIEIKRKQDAEALEQRRQWAGELKQAQVAKKKNLPPLKKELDGKRGAVDAARQALKEAETEANRAQAALDRETQRLNFTITGLEGQLRGTASPAIDEAIQFFRDKFYELRRPGSLQRRAALGKFSLIHLKWMPGEKESNSEAIKKAMDYCNTAIKKLEALKIEPAVSATEIEKIGEAMPGIDTFEVFEDPKPFADVKGKFLPPRIPSKTERLLDKANRVIHGI